ncbi:MAG: adenylyltransferase/cytidyltransferase family protein [Candidatus Gracilibacteria bacterium]|jgi:D-beta-D-heptose 7-phosphate kinase/D-beta-D-heptose 1-phosphate adenosyltransferase
MLFDLNNSTDVEVVQTYLRCSRENERIIGLTSGSFDLIHFHHFLYFIRCRRSCDVLIVGVDSDELVRKMKGEGRPLIYDSRRVVMVDALKPVTFAFIMNSVDDFGLAAKIINPDFIFKSDSFDGREEEIIGKEHAKKIKIIRDVVDHTSTTEILEQAARIANTKK